MPIIAADTGGFKGNSYAKNRMLPKAAHPEDGRVGHSFSLITTPTPLQQRAFELLRVPLAM